MTDFNIRDYATNGPFLGNRQLALPIRDRVVSALDRGETVVLDFLDTNPSQAFVDELVGALVLKRGPTVLDSLLLKNCHEDLKTILHFVVSDRIEQHEQHAQRSPAIH